MLATRVPTVVRRSPCVLGRPCSNQRSTTSVRAEATSSSDMAGLPVLTYFDGRGNAQRVRYALVGAGLKWTERYLKAAGDMDRVRPDCLFGQVPLLEIDGHKIVQSWAIVRYLGAKDNLPPDRAWVADAAAETVRDWFSDAGLLGFGWSPDRAPALAKAEAAAARYLPGFERALKDRYLTGPQPCWADFQLLSVLDYTVDLLGEAALEGFPKVIALREGLRELPGVQEFYASEHYKGLVDLRYMMEVRAALSSAKA